jgi:uncharacterized protein YyaL (SSP411 family)
MADGGIYDHLGGGFHRYSTDAAWHVPHFEKMLYDQAQMVVVLLDTLQRTGERRFGDIARHILAYVERSMTGEEGGFLSAEDADSVKPGTQQERGEGAFYVWSRKEVMDLLGDETGGLFVRRYGIRENGNVELDPHGEFAGMNILHRVTPVEDPANMTGRPEAEIAAVLAEARARLLRVRETRPHPFKDDKVLTAWNGLMITAFARAGKVLDEPAMTGRAGRAAEFVLTHLRDAKTGRLLRRWRAAEARYPAHLDDYAFLVQGLLDLYESSFTVRWLREAVALTRRMLDEFGDPESGRLYDTTGEDPSILVRTVDLYDGAEPSGQSVAAMNLIRLSHITGDEGFRTRGERILASAAGMLARQPELVPSMAASLDLALGPVREIVIVGNREEEGVRLMMNEVRRRYLPDAVVLLKEDNAEALEEIAPFVSVLGRKESKPAAYVCRDHTCRLPVTDAAALAVLLDEEIPAHSGH